MIHSRRHWAFVTLAVVAGAVIFAGSGLYAGVPTILAGTLAVVWGGGAGGIAHTHLKTGWFTSTDSNGWAAVPPLLAGLFILLPTVLPGAGTLEFYLCLLGYGGVVFGYAAGIGTALYHGTNASDSDAHASAGD